MKKLLHELMGWQGPMTQRQYATWQAWLDLEWNRPSRADHYAIRVAAAVLKTSDEDGLKIKFRTKSVASDGPPMTREQAATVARATGQAMGGPPVEVKTRRRSEAQIYGVNCGLVKKG